MAEAFGNDIISGALMNLVERQSNALARHLQKYTGGDWTLFGSQEVPFTYGFAHNSYENINNSYYFRNEDRINLSILNYNNYNNDDSFGLNFKISLVAPNIGRANSNDQLDITYNENNNKNNWSNDWSNYNKISMKYTQAGAAPLYDITVSFSKMEYEWGNQMKSNSYQETSFAYTSQDYYTSAKVTANQYNDGKGEITLNGGIYQDKLQNKSISIEFLYASGDIDGDSDIWSSNHLFAKNIKTTTDDFSATTSIVDINLNAEQLKIWKYYLR